MVVGYVGVPASALIVGLVIGLTYALTAAGLLLVYRATRVVNFAHGQIGSLAAVLLAKLVLDHQWNFWLALAVAVASGAVIGGLIELTIIRRLFHAPRLQLFVATMGVAQLLLLVQFLIPQIETFGLWPSPLSWSRRVAGFRLSSPEIMVLLFVPPAVLAVGGFLTRTWRGLAIRATADDADLSELSGMSTRRVSTMVWMIAGALAALTSVLLNPVLGTPLNGSPSALGPGLLLPALAAALIGKLQSLRWTLVGGVAIGVWQSLLTVNFPRSPGLVQASLFVLILVLVLVRRVPGGDEASGQWSLALRVKPIPEAVRHVWWAADLGKLLVAAAVALAIVLPVAFDTAERIYLFSSVLVVALAGLSVTVLTGWAGQLSLGQYAFVGLGAVTAGSLASNGYSFAVAVAYAVVAGAVAALLVGFPALRVRGLFLAITTLAFAVAAQSWLFRLDVFHDDGLTGQIRFPRSELFGIIDLHSQRSYYYLCLAVLAATAVAASRLRRTGIGRSFVAASNNEPCGASFGLSMTAAKLTAFTFAGAIAALAGALYAGLNVIFSLDSGPTQPTPFGPEQSMQIVAMAVIGGLGSISGTIVGALYVVGLPALFRHNALVGFGSTAVGLLFLLLYLPGGLASVGYRLRDALIQLALRRRGPAPASGPPAVDRVLPAQRGADLPPLPAGVAHALETDGVTVRFGGITALSDVSITARPGEVVGLIGSNGAGKSTLMNVISGFQPAGAGEVRLWDDDVTLLPPHQRARLGVGRVFQDARLFGDLTVRETVQLALEVHERSEFVPSLLGYPPSRRIERQRAADADDFIAFLGLGRYENAFVSDLSTGTRRVVELCCLLARGSRLLLLDEPTAGVAQRETEAFGPLIQRIRAELDATVLIIEHDMPLVMSIADRVYALDAGRCIAEGPPDAVRRDPLVIASYLGTDDRAIARSGARSTAPGRRQRTKQLSAATSAATRNGNGDRSTRTGEGTEEPKVVRT